MSQYTVLRVLPVILTPPLPHPAEIILEECRQKPDMLPEYPYVLLHPWMGKGHIHAGLRAALYWLHIRLPEAGALFPVDL